MSIANSLLILLVEQLDEWHKVFQSSDLQHARDLQHLAVSLAAKLKTGRDLGDDDGRRKPWSEERRRKVGSRVKAGWEARRALQPFMVHISGDEPIEVVGYDNVRRLIYGDTKRLFPGLETPRDTPYLATTTERQVKTIKNGLAAGGGTYSTNIVNVGELYGAPVTITRLVMPTAGELRAAVNAAVNGAPAPAPASAKVAKKKRPMADPITLDEARPRIRRVPPKKTQP